MGLDELLGELGHRPAGDHATAIEQADDAVSNAVIIGVQLQK